MLKIFCDRLQGMHLMTYFLGGFRYYALFAGKKTRTGRGNMMFFEQLMALHNNGEEFEISIYL